MCRNGTSKRMDDEVLVCLFLCFFPLLYLIIFLPWAGTRTNWFFSLSLSHVFHFPSYFHKFFCHVFINILTLICWRSYEVGHSFPSICYLWRSMVFRWNLYILQNHRLHLRQGSQLYVALLPNSLSNLNWSYCLLIN